MTQICVGSSHTAILTQKNEVFTWGWGDQGQLGHGGYRNETKPRWLETLRFLRQELTPAASDRTRGSVHPSSVISPGLIVVSISTGDDFTAALTQTGRLYTWGCNKRGQLGVGLERNVPIPTLVQGLRRRVTSFDCGSAFMCAICEPGFLYAWGAGYASGQPVHQSIDGSVLDDQLVPAPVSILEPKSGLSTASATHRKRRAREVACGRDHALVLSQYGDLYAFGRNKFGQLGVGDKEDRALPAHVEAIPKNAYLSGIACGARHSLAFNNQNIFSWGWNKFGQLGLGDTTDRLSPCALPRLNNRQIQQVTAGWRQSSTMTDDGSVFSWGQAPSLLHSTTSTSATRGSPGRRWAPSSSSSPTRSALPTEQQAYLLEKQQRASKDPELVLIPTLVPLNTLPALRIGKLPPSIVRATRIHSAWSHTLSLSAVTVAGGADLLNQSPRSGAAMKQVARPNEVSKETARILEAVSTIAAAEQGSHRPSGSPIRLSFPTSTGTTPPPPPHRGNASSTIVGVRTVPQSSGMGASPSGFRAESSYDPSTLFQASVRILDPTARQASSPPRRGSPERPPKPATLPERYGHGERSGKAQEASVQGNPFKHSRHLKGVTGLEKRAVSSRRISALLTPACLAQMTAQELKEVVHTVPTKTSKRIATDARERYSKLVSQVEREQSKTQGERMTSRTSTIYGGEPASSMSQYAVAEQERGWVQVTATGTEAIDLNPFRIVGTAAPTAETPNPALVPEPSAAIQATKSSPVAGSAQGASAGGVDGLPVTGQDSQVHRMAVEGEDHQEGNAPAPSALLTSSSSGLFLAPGARARGKFASDYARTSRTTARAQGAPESEKREGP